MTLYLLSLDSPDATLDLAGGKGANLSRLIRAGFPTPGGFVVSTAAYHAFVAANDMADFIAAQLAALDTANVEALDHASAAIRARFEQGTLPADLAAAILSGYHALSNPKSQIPNPKLPVAVRSSATAEDLPDASFAGQQDTFLNVRGDAALLDAVRRCWGSLWTARAIAYRHRQAIAPAGVSLAIVVQAMVPAEAAGILFTLNPVTGARDEAMINAAWGLGEAVVGGKVMPDTLIVDRATGRIRQAEIAPKAVMTAPTADGTAEIAVDEARREQAVLSPEQAATLARLGGEIEALFGGPQDIEWAIAGGQSYILQARPVTAAGGAARSEVPGDDGWPIGEARPTHPFDLWTQTDVGERFTEPVTPLTASITPALMNGAVAYMLRSAPVPDPATIGWYGRFFGRIYFNEGAIAEASEAMGSSNPLGDEVAAFRPPLDPSPQARRATGRRMAAAFPAMMRDAVADERAFRALRPQIGGWVASFLATPLDAVADSQLWDSWNLWFARAQRLLNLYSAWSSGTTLYFRMLDQRVEQWTGMAGTGPQLVAGLPGLEALEMGPALQRLAQAARDAGLSASDLEARDVWENPAHPLFSLFHAFLARFGHNRHAAEELRYPRWADAPEQVAEMVAGYLRAGTTMDLAAAAQRQAAQREALVTTIEARLNPMQRAVFRPLLRRVQTLVLIRDNGRDEMLKVLQPLRRIAVELARRWVGRGWLAAADDVFFLTKDELGRLAHAGDPSAASADLAVLVAARRAAYDHWFAVPPPPHLGPDGQPLTRPDRFEKPVRSELQGIAASAGRVTGTARLLHDPREATRLQPGDILVTRATDPAWTAIFPLVRGLVMEIGGPLSHGAIVAREYAIPAVTSVAGAMTRLADGQRITVDGSAGWVRIEEE